MKAVRYIAQKSGFLKTDKCIFFLEYFPLRGKDWLACLHPYPQSGHSQMPVVIPCHFEGYDVKTNLD